MPSPPNPKPNPSPSNAPRVLARVFVGRQAELNVFDDFLQENSPHRILALTSNGDGGVGKTRLVTRMHDKIAVKSDDIITFHPIDFYHLESRTSRGVMRTIAIAFQFNDFLKKELQSQQADNYISLKALQREFRTALTDYVQHQAAVGKQVVFFFIDSYEYVQKVVPHPTLGPASISHTELSHWLEEEIIQPLAHDHANTRFILAGRYPPCSLQNSPEYLAMPLGSFQLEEAKDYLLHGFLPDDDERQHALEFRGRDEILADYLPQGMIPKFFHLAEGRPIYLALLMDWVNQGQRTLAEDLIAAIEQEIGPIPEHGLARDHRELFEKKIIQSIREGRDTAETAMTYVAIAFRRLTPRILEVLTGIAEAEGIKLIERLREWSFVKPKDGAILLHDEMRRLLEKYYWQGANVALQREALQNLANYYETELLWWQDAQKKKQQMRNHRQEYTTYFSEWLEYQLRLDYPRAYAEFYNEFAIALQDGHYDYADALLRIVEEYVQQIGGQDNFDSLALRVHRIGYLAETHTEQDAVITLRATITADIQRWQDHPDWPDSAMQGQFAMYLAQAYFHEKNYGQAIECFDQALGAFQLNAEDYWAARCLNWMGYCHYQQANFVQAEEYLQRARKSFSKLRDNPAYNNSDARRRLVGLGMQLVLGNQAMLYWYMGRYHEALGHARSLLLIARGLERNRRELARSLITFAKIMDALGHKVESQVRAQEALTIAEEIQDSQLRARAHLVLFWHTLNIGAFTYPVEYYRPQGPTELLQIQQESGLADKLTTLAERTEEALTLLGERPIPERTEAWLALSYVAMLRKDFSQGQTHLAQALLNARATGFRYHHAMIFKTIAHFAYLAGEKDPAQSAAAWLQTQTNAPTLPEIQQDLARYPDLAARMAMVQGNAWYDQAETAVRQPHWQVSAVADLLYQAFQQYSQAGVKFHELNQLAYQSYHWGKRLLFRRVVQFIRHGNDLAIAPDILAQCLQPLPQAWSNYPNRDKEALSRLYEYGKLSIAPMEKLARIQCVAEELRAELKEYENLEQNQLSWRILFSGTLAEAYRHLHKLEPNRAAYQYEAVRWLLYQSRLNRNFGDSYQADHAVRVARDEITPLWQTVDQLQAADAAQVRSLYGELLTAEGTLQYRHSHYNKVLELYLRGQLQNARERFDAHWSTRREQAMGLLQQAEQVVKQALALQDNPHDRQTLASLYYRMGELLMLGEQFTGAQGALTYLQHSIDLSPPGSYRQVDAMGSYITAAYFCGQVAPEEEARRQDYEKQLVDNKNWQTQYPGVFGKLYITLGDRLFSQFFSQKDEPAPSAPPKMPEMRRMFGYYLNAAHCLAERHNPADFADALRALYERVRRIKELPMLELARSSVENLWHNYPNLRQREEELNNLMDYIQTRRNLSL